MLWKHKDYVLYVKKLRRESYYYHVNINVYVITVLNKLRYVHFVEYILNKKLVLLHNFI